MAESRGKLILSTKSQASGRKTIILVCSVLLYLFALFLFLNRDVFSDLGRDAFRSATAGHLLGWCVIIFFIAWPTFNLIMAQIGSKSYCDVYENAVVGTTCLSAANPNAPMQNFELPYSQIVNVTEANKNLTIHTSHGSYEVLALKNRSEAVQAIRARMTGT